LPRPEDLFAIPRRTFDELASRLGRGLIANARAHRVQFERAGARLSLSGLMRLAERGRERVAALGARKMRGLERRLERMRAGLVSQTALLEALSYRNVLARGFAVVRDAGVPVRAAAGIVPGSRLDIEFQDGHVGVTVAVDRSGKKPAPGTQGSLF
jgi:exodeoxyribonuclease VII large subunit